MKRRQGRLPRAAPYDAALSYTLLLILRGRRGDERDPAQADAGAPFALEEGELQGGADVDLGQTEVVIVVLIGGGHDFASVLKGEEGRKVHSSPHLVVENGAEGALLVDEAVVGKNEVRAVHLIVRMCFEFTHKTPFIGAAGERPRSFLSREDELAYGDLLGACTAGIHSADPFELVTGLQILGHALGLCELIGDALDHRQRVVVDLDEVVVQSAGQKQLCENAFAVLLQKPLAHAPEAADIALGLLGHGETGVVVVADEIVGEAVGLVIDGGG